MSEKSVGISPLTNLQNDPDLKPRMDVSKSKLNAEAEEFVPFTPNGGCQQDDDEFDDIIEFNTLACVVEMSQRPHDFNEIFFSYSDVLMPFLEDDDTSEKLALTLMKVCNNEPNCRYIGVKLAQKLNSESINKKLIKKLFDNTEKKYFELVTEFNSVDSKVIENFSLYVGELYVQFEDEKYARYKVLREAVTMLSEKLLSSQNDKHFFTLGLLLKLAGQSLHEDCSNILEELIGKVSLLRPNDPKARIVIDSVVRMHSECWQVDEKNTQNTEILSDQDEECDPVLYGPDGSVISSEECSFLSACLESNTFFGTGKN